MSRTVKTASLALLGLLLVCLSPHGALAGGTGTTELAMPQGATAGTAVGDYVSDTGGLNTFYSFFFEVPPGLPRLVIDLFDADFGAGGTAEAAAGRDRARGTGFVSTVEYSLLNPSGNVVARETGTTSGPGDNAWLDLLDTSFPAFAGLATASAGTNVTTLTVPMPPGVASGDQLIAVIALDGTGNPDTPTGWTVVDEGACTGGGGGACRLEVLRRTATGSEVNVTFTWTGIQQAIGAVFRFTGVSAATPVNAWGANTGTSTTPTAPSVTTTVANTRILRLYAADANVAAASPYPAGTRPRFNLQSSTTAGDAVTAGAAESRQAAAGATGTAAFALPASEQWRAVTLALAPSAPAPAAGHWELRVDSGSGNDINALGVRAHDGDPTAGGTEVPVYSDSFFSYGVNSDEPGDASTRTYTHYPWITEGCRIEFNDFDWDSASGVPPPLTNTGRVTLTSRASLFSQTVQPLSGNNVWANNQLNPFTTATDSLDYGPWTMDVVISEYLPAGNANYGVVYLGDDGLGAPPPASQPVPDAFRTYLPTDAGAAPAKPYLEQQLRWTCAGSGILGGPNPPQVGQTSCFTLTLRLVNPTAWPLTFSTPTNVVTARVPGSGVTYAGGAVVSQGTVVSAPALGGTGDIVWNPGTVAAGTTSLLSYHVSVAPAAPGTIVATGTHLGGDGSRARYVDETGNTTQARATYELGPICELAASTEAPTPAVVVDLRAAPSPEGVLVTWETASEVGTASLELQRLERATNAWVPVGDGPLSADPAALGGSVYRLLDRGADPSAFEVYRVVEREVRGGERAHGPYLARAADRPAERFAPRAEVAPRAWPAPAREPLLRAHVAPEATGARGARPPVEGKGAAGLKIGVAEAGLVLLPAAQIASGLGLAPGEVASRLASGGFALSRGGDPVAWTAAAGNAGLLFFGEGVESPYSREAVYVLKASPGARMAAIATKVPPGEPAGALLSIASAEIDRFAATVVATDPESDYWFWEALLGADPVARRRSFPLEAPDALPDLGPAALRLGVHGASEGAHRVAVSLNGVSLGEIEFQGLVPFAGELAVPAGVVRSGPNTIELEALPLPGGGSHDLFADRFELVYPRRLAALADALELTAGSAGPVSVDGFGWREVAVLDLADPLRPRLQREVQVRMAGDGFRATFAAEAGRRYLLASPAGYRAPAWTRPLLAPGLLAPGRGAEYLVVTAEPLRAAAEELAALRAAAGLSTAVVTVEEIHDELAGGFPTPHAIRELLARAAASWRPAPRYVVLAGAGHFDYRDLLGYGGNWVPPLLAPSRHGLFAADGRFADLAGGDGVPEVAIGRIPARTAAELSAYVAKLAAYEAALPGASGAALLVADDPEPGFDFAGGLAELAGWLPAGFQQEWVRLLPGQVGAARAALLSGLAAGANLLAYSGHGGLDRLAAEGLLTLGDLPSLPAAGELPVVLALTCVLNRFELPMLAPLGARLVTEPGVGAVAVWSASGISSHPRVENLGQLFFDEIGRAPGARLGDLMRGAQQRFAQRQGSEALSIYNLLGDPALRVAVPPPPPLPPGPAGQGE